MIMYIHSRALFFSNLGVVPRVQYSQYVLGSIIIELAEVCEVVIELYYQEVWLVLDNIYMRICLAPTHVTDQGLPIQQ